MQQLDIKSFDSTPIHCYLWDDVESPKGVVQISHGMCEYAGRYHEVAQMFNEHGYIVFADDHRATETLRPTRTAADIRAISRERPSRILCSSTIGSRSAIIFRRC